MEQEIIQLVKDLSYPAVVALALIILNRAGVFGLIADWFRGRISSSDSETRERVKKIETNHLAEINRRLEVLEQNDIRIDVRLNKLGEDVAWLRAKINGK